MSADLKELRIRNLLMYGDKLVEVSAIFRSHFNCESIDGISYGNSIQSNFEPIPLTKEWLLNFGFKVNRKTKEGNNIWRCNWTEGHFEIEQIASFFLNDNSCYGTEIKFCHQLQNLYFCICGEELTF